MIYNNNNILYSTFYTIHTLKIALYLKQFETHVQTHILKTNTIVHVHV